MEKRNDIKICVLCLNHKTIYKDSIKAANETWIKHCKENNIDVYRYIGSTYNKIDNDVIYCNCKDDMGHSFEKTICALKQLNLDKYDFIVRTNLSTYINVKSLITYCQFLKDNNYDVSCGDIAVYINNKLGYRGNSFIFSINTIKRIINYNGFIDNIFNKDNHVDDMIISRILNTFDDINIHNAPYRYFSDDEKSHYYHHPLCIHEINEKNINGIVFISYRINREKIKRYNRNINTNNNSKNDTDNRDIEVDYCYKFDNIYNNLDNSISDNSSLLYDMNLNNFIYAPSITEYLKGKKDNHKIRTLLCTMLRNENNYLDEFIEYYRNLGFTNIVLYDNNDINGETLDIKNNEDGFVIIENIRGKNGYIKRCYTEAYNKYKSQYDWIAFFDVDEFLYFNIWQISTIEDYLSLDIFKNYDCIKVNWKNYGDDDQEKVKNNNYSITRFKNPLPVDFKIDNEFPYNCHIKPIVRCIDDHIIFKTPHIPENININKYCDSEGNPSSKFAITNINYNICELRHFYTKTIDEFIRKITRGIPDANITNASISYYEIENKVRIFKKINKLTPYKEKRINYILEKFKNNKINKDNISIFNIEKYIGDNDFEKYKEFLGNFYNINTIKGTDLNNFVCLYNDDNLFNFDNEDIFKDIQTHEICLKQPNIYQNSIFNEFNNKYQNKDLLVIGAIIKKYYPDYLYDYNFLLTNKELYNLYFIINSVSFNNILKFIFDILNRFIEYKEQHNEELLNNGEELGTILFNIYINKEIYMMFLSKII